MPDDAEMTDSFNYHFEWDLIKATSNQRKHNGINFELAATVFNDPLMLSVPNHEQGETEERWLTMGQAENNKLLLVIHTYQETSTHSANVRIISAREATKHEQHQYEVDV
jgi:uncharacterized DUF497 family protein